MATFLGISERSTCDCCGKANLKRTVALDMDGETVYYGTSCAALALKMEKKAVNKQAREAQQQQTLCGLAFDQGRITDAERAEMQAEENAVADFRTWVRAESGNSDAVTGMWSKFGSMYAARDAYMAANPGARRPKGIA